MKHTIIILTVILIISINSFAQTVQENISINATYRINTIYPLGKYRLWVTLTNNSNYDYKDVTYQITYIAGNGTEEGTNSYVLHDFIGKGMSKTLNEQYLECPKDCKAIRVAVIDGTKLKSSN